MIVDTHTHLFAPDVQRYPLADPTASYRPLTDGAVELLKRQMDEAGVDRAVTISPWPYRWDISHALDVLASHRSWLAVAVLIDPRSPDGPERANALRKRTRCLRSADSWPSDEPRALR